MGKPALIPANQPLGKADSFSVSSAGRGQGDAWFVLEAFSSHTDERFPPLVKGLCCLLLEVRQDPSGGSRWCEEGSMCPG